MVQGMAELLQRSNNTGEVAANYPLSPLAESHRDRLMPIHMSPSSTCSVSVDSSDDERQSEPEVLSRGDVHHRSDFSSSSGDPVHQIVVPRTVPCIVLTPPANLNTGTSFANGSPIPVKSPEEGSTCVSSLLVGNGANNIVGRVKDNEMSLNLTVERQQVKRDGDKDKNSGEKSAKKLTFGIDRILAGDDDAESGLNLMKPKPKEAGGHPIEFNLKSYHNNHNEDHHHHQHQGLGDGYASQCTECFFLARYCRRIQFPLTSTTVGSTFSWLGASPTMGQSAESPTSLLSSNGFVQHPNIPYGMTSSSYSSISPMVSCNTTGNGRRKRSWSRAVFSNLQRKGLEKRFQLQKYITKPDRRQLAATLGLTDAQVKVWFQNRRMKWRHSKEGKQGTAAVPEDPTQAAEKK